ncbi:glycosyltransferase WbsX family protein [Butyrivibrio sp. INlla14]|uniref:glycosyltransferase WbsX family protein n=1 Tax=Butyrivibrio sp. INlla14 TaxID=1520808 RepID=UPI0008765321|nr:glycoside hydrolase family 99-like domain-containing protein [Butyrivibrio sp. INlla14]SCY72597.1 Glycosyltransferase WbsX [Butyrivibrio sp. INlla14]
MRLVALYLPQYHPTEINDKWYGKGFTEWTNVASAKPLFKGHYEPHIPADLGFYDLRLPEVRREQARLAQEYGVEAFCYWTYWFGNGETALDMPIWEVYKDKSITLPFCLGWGNHSWEKKTWDNNAKNELIVEQKYLGEGDYSKFFYTMLPLFKDERYFRVNNKCFFIIYEPLDNAKEISAFITKWRELATKEGIGDFFFVGKDFDSRDKDKILSVGFDAIYNDDVFNIHHKLSLLKKVLLKFQREVLRHPTVFKYKDALKYMITDDCKNDNVIPTVAPNWDHSPRSGANAIILEDCQPKYFKKVLEIAKETVEHKDSEKQLVIVKSWNEWGEGNHLEPDRKYGRGYLEAIRDVMREG